VPILVLSARQASDEKVPALDAGADDYATKPLSGTTVIATTDFTVDLLAKKATRDGRDVRLTPTEWHPLEIVVCSPGRLITQKQLLQED
jgi:two-component system KDP operon response regulator KdpE